MDRNWILRDDRISKEYKDGIESFLAVARNHLNHKNECLCPCRKCVNRSFASLRCIRIHLMRSGFSMSYDVWVCHGEKELAPSNFLAGSNSRVRAVVNEPIIAATAVVNEPITAAIAENLMEEDDVLRPIYEDLFRGAEQESDLDGQFSAFADNDNTDKLYLGCKFSTLEAVIRLMHIKVTNRWSEKSFQMLLDFIKIMWPDLNKFPSSMYDARKRLFDVGLGYEKIDACKNDCSLFWKEYARDEQCHVCGESRYKVNDGKGKKIPHKSLRYFPLTPRLKRLFLSRHTAIDMRWHKDKRDDSSDTLQHPADGKAWKHLDVTNPHFADDARNVRLGLAADGFCPFSASYSIWPVIVVPYNMPPWICMQQPFRFLTLLIPGPTSPGKDIDVYLQPLVDELKVLWNVGVDTYDAASHNKFKMRAALLWTINDFPAYGNLSGWSTHGKRACPVCMEDTTSEQCVNKICFMGHRRYLALTHTWRRSRLHDGRLEQRPSPKMKTGREILFHLNRLPLIVFGKHSNNRDNKRKRAPVELNWTKKSVFFELPYWCDLLIRHMLDVMHIEKNVCDNVLHTLLDTDGRTKDTLKSRIDLERLKIRPELHLKKLPNGKIVKPAASYVLKPADRIKFLEFIKSIKFPDGYAANLSRGVNVREGKIYGLKSHDCHVIFQRLLPIAIRPFLGKDLCTTLVDFSYFFQQLTSKSLRKSDLDSLQELIVMVLCKLERIYPPAFFDVMIHLAVHLVMQVTLAGPVWFWWMYSFERDMGIYKNYIKNRAHPEASIAEAYSIKEAVNFCAMYFDHNEPQFAVPERNNDEPTSHGTISVFSQRAKAFGEGKPGFWSKSDIDQIHWSVLNNCDELMDFVNEHMTILEMESTEDLYARHQQYFPKWFEQRMQSLRREGSSLATDELFALSKEPSRTVVTYPRCIVNGVRYRVRDFDGRKTTQNSGVEVLGEHGHGSIDYYGYLTNVIVLEYIKGYKVVVFKCDWFDTDPTKKWIKQDYRFTCINTKHKWGMDDPYILASQAKQVFYLDDPKFGKDWKIVQRVQQRQIWDISEKENSEDLNEASPLTLPYQQNESVRVEINEFDPDLPMDDLHRGDIEQTSLSEQELDRLRQSPQVADDYMDTYINDDFDDENLNQNDSDSDGDY